MNAWLIQRLNETSLDSRLPLSAAFVVCKDVYHRRSLWPEVQTVMLAGSRQSKRHKWRHDVLSWLCGHCSYFKQSGVRAVNSASASLSLSLQKILGCWTYHNPPPTPEIMQTHLVCCGGTGSLVCHGVGKRKQAGRAALGMKRGYVFLKGTHCTLCENWHQVQYMKEKYVRHTLWRRGPLFMRPLLKELTVWLTVTANDTSAHFIVEPS